MTDKRLRGDIESLQQGETHDDWVAVVRPGNKVTIEHANHNPMCSNPYHKSVIGTDGVARVGLPSGKAVVCRPCTNPLCTRPSRPVVLTQAQAAEFKGLHPGVKLTNVVVP